MCDASREDGLRRGHSWCSVWFPWGTRWGSPHSVASDDCWVSFSVATQQCLSRFHSTVLESISLISSAMGCQEASTGAGLLWGFLAVRRQTDIVGHHHLSHELNQLTNCISRHGSWSEVLALDRRLSGGFQRLQPETQRIQLECSELLRLCDPRSPLSSDAVFEALFRGAQT